MNGKLTQRDAHRSGIKKPSVAIVHPRMGRGGSESFVMWAAQALHGDYDVSILSSCVARPGEFELLNQYYGTTLRRQDVRLIEIPLLRWCRPAALRGALWQRYCQKAVGAYDVVISAYGPTDFGKPAIQTIADFSWDPKLRDLFDHPGKNVQSVLGRLKLMRAAYSKLCRWLSRPSGREMFRGEDLFLMNSEWSAGVLNRHYCVDNLAVIYAPVSAVKSNLNWRERESGFVCLGSINYEKRIETTIETLRQVRRLGHDVHLHVVGRVAEDRYGRIIRELADIHSDWVFLEGQLSGDEKWQILGKHRFGIHARTQEAFGIAVAEMAGAGCICFVPNDGGPVEIIRDPALRYSNVGEAVEKIVAVLKSPEEQERKSDDAVQWVQEFSSDAFISRIQDAVARFVMAMKC